MSQEQRAPGIVTPHFLRKDKGEAAAAARTRDAGNMNITARLAQSVERKALNLVVVGSSSTVGVLSVDWWSKAVISVITYYYSN